MKRLLRPTPQTFRVSLGLLVMRVVMGAALSWRGAGKLPDLFSWSTEPIPGILQAMAALTEFVGGAALVVGAVTPIAAAGIACTMAVAVWLHLDNNQPFVGHDTFELARMYLAFALVLLITGPGRFAMDNRLWRANGPVNKLEA